MGEGARRLHLYRKKQSALEGECAAALASQIRVPEMRRASPSAAKAAKGAAPCGAAEAALL